MKATRIISIALAAVFLQQSLASADTSNQWALSYLKAVQIWHLNKGEGVVVAIIDSGVSPNGDLAENLLSGADFSAIGNKSSGDGHRDTEPNGHGTGMATIVAGSGLANNGSGTIGLAPASNVLPIRAASDSATDLVFAMPLAIKYAVDHDARVVNLSIGGPIDDPAIHKAVQAAIDRDVVVVAAVGNEGTSQPRYPAAYPGVLGVGAIDSDGKVWSKSNNGADVALVAPGVHIYRDDNKGRQGYSDGTSEATAYVSAAAALVRSAHPGWTAPQVIRALISTADKPAALAGLERNDQYGYGILNVLAAVRLAAPPAVVASASSSSESMSGATSAGTSPSSGATGIAAPDSDRSNNAVALLVSGAVLALTLGALIAVSALRRRQH